MSRCRRCLLPSNVPDADFDADGVCSFCRNYRAADEALVEEARMARLVDLEATLGRARQSNGYDALVA